LAGNAAPPGDIHGAGMRQRRAVDNAASRSNPADRRGIPPDSVAARSEPVSAIKAAAIARNIRHQRGATSATFALAQALAICSLPHRQQNRKCLQIIHWMIFFSSGCIRPEHERYQFW
jgi:hypothetical protein